MRTCVLCSVTNQPAQIQRLSWIPKHVVRLAVIVFIYIKRIKLCAEQNVLVYKLACNWRSSHNAVTHVRKKNSNIQGRSPYVAKSDFRGIRNCS